MADGALVSIGLLAGIAGGLGGCEAAEPDHFVGVYVEDVVDGIDRGSAPLGAAVKTREYGGVLVTRHGKELAVAVDVLLEILHGPGVGLGGAGGEHVLSEALAGVGLGVLGKALSLGGDFAGERAGRV